MRHGRQANETAEEGSNMLVTVPLAHVRQTATRAEERLPCALVHEHDSIVMGF